MILLDDIDDQEYYDTQITEHYDSGFIIDDDDSQWNYKDDVEQRLEIYLNDI